MGKHTKRKTRKRTLDPLYVGEGDVIHYMTNGIVMLHKPKRIGAHQPKKDRNR